MKYITILDYCCGQVIIRRYPNEDESTDTAEEWIKNTLGLKSSEVSYMISNSLNMLLDIDNEK